VSVFPFSPGSPSAHRLSLKDDLRHWNKWEKSSSLGIPTFSAGTAGTKALWLCIHIPKARASAISNFCASLWRLLIFLTIFRKIHQNSTFAQGIVSAYLWPKNPISGGLGAPNPNFVLQIRGKRKQFWGIFRWGMEDPVFHPWKFGKDPTRNGGEINGPNLGFQITDNTCAILNEEDARRWRRKLAVQTRAFSFYSSSQWVNHGDLWPLQAPIPLGGGKPSFTCAGSPWDGYLLNPKWRRCGQNWRHIVGLKFPKIKV